MTRRILMYAAIAGGTALFLAAIGRRSSAQSIPRGYGDLEEISSKVDKYIPGFSKFAAAVAYWESRGNSSAQNTSDSEAGAACRGWQRKRDTMFADNPYPAEDWCWGSGGWFGLIPSTGLSADGFHNLDPMLVLDPQAQVAMFAAFVRRVVKNHFHKLPPSERNWLAVRRFAAGNTVGLDWREEKVLQSDRDGIPRAYKVRERFAKSLRAVGLPESFMFESVRIRSWPGALHLWEELR